MLFIFKLFEVNALVSIKLVSPVKGPAIASAVSSPLPQPIGPIALKVGLGTLFFLVFSKCLETNNLSYTEFFYRILLLRRTSASVPVLPSQHSHNHLLALVKPGVFLD